MRTADDRTVVHVYLPVGLSVLSSAQIGILILSDVFLRPWFVRVQQVFFGRIIRHRRIHYVFFILIKADDLEAVEFRLYVDKLSPTSQEKSPWLSL